MSSTGNEDFLNQVRQAVWSVNGNLPVASVRTLDEVYDLSLARTSFALVMLAIAGAMALVVAAVLASYLPARRAAAVDPVEALRVE